MLRIRSFLPFIALLTLSGAAAADDPKAAREHEMLRRTQEALRQSQADASDLSQQKTQAEEKLKTTTEQLDSVRSASKSAEASLHAQLKTATTAQADLTRQLEEARSRLAELTSRQAQTAEQLKIRDGELTKTQAELAGSKTANSSCEAKNLKLYEYSEELTRRYRDKGVWASLSQKEPVLGLKQVDMENVLQEYHEKLEAQKLKTSPAP